MIDGRAEGDAAVGRGTATMPVRPDQKTSTSIPSGRTTGITPVTGMWTLHRRRPGTAAVVGGCTARSSSPSLADQRVREVAAAAEGLVAPLSHASQFLS